MWAWAADVSLQRAGAGDPIHASKIATARFYFQRILPQSLALAAEIRAGAASLMEPADELL
jgi:Acetyl-CoA dehydrogenase C-terminal like